MFFFYLQLQDLAVSPDIQDPSLNTAQCVTQGHKPNLFDSKRHTVYMLPVCNIFVMSTGFIFSWVIFYMNKLRCRKTENTTLNALCFSIHFLSVLCNVYFLFACGLALYFSPIFFLGTLACIITWSGIEYCINASTHSLSLSYENRKLGKALICLYTFGGRTICYISCWLVIGIKINPSWGLTVALSVISIFAAWTYAVYLFGGLSNTPTNLCMALYCIVFTLQYCTKE